MYFCCCGPPNHSVGFWCISVAVALQIILQVLVYFCCCGPANYTGGSCVFPLLWPCKLYWGFLCISVAVANYWVHAIYLKLVLPSFPIWDAYSFQFACGTFWHGPTLFATKVTTTLCGMWNLGRSSFYYTDIVPVRKYDCDITIATSNSPFLFVDIQCAWSHLL